MGPRPWKLELSQSTAGQARCCRTRMIPCGTQCALNARMEKIDDYKKLVAWQLSMELGDLVDDMTSDPPAAADQDFCDQIRKSSSKPAPQVAEGFLRFRPKESAYYYRIARASLGETQSHLLRGRHRKFWSEEVFKKAWDVSEGALKTTTGLLASRLRAIEEEAQRKRRQPKSEGARPSSPW